MRPLPPPSSLLLSPYSQSSQLQLPNIKNSSLALALVPENPIQIIQHPVKLLTAAAKHHLSGHHILELVLIVHRLHLLRFVDVRVLQIVQIYVLVRLHLHDELQDVLAAQVVYVL